MNLCHVITGLDTGGAETVLCRLLEALRPPAFEHTVIALGSVGTLSARVAQSATLYHLGMRAGMASPRDVLRLRHVLKKSKPDVIQAWMYHANLMATLAAIGAGVPLLWGIRQSLYDMQWEKRTTRWVIRANRMLSWRADHIIYNSSTSAMQHEAFGFRRARRLIIPNGFDTGVFRLDDSARARVRSELAVGDEDLAIGLVARWHPMKDHVNFLRAAALLVRSCPRAVFVLAGEGVDSGNAELASLIDSLALGERVRLCGRRTDIPAMDAALDIASSSSSWGEAFPNAIGEAMACAVPCIATDVGDVREIIADTGIVVPPSDPEVLCAGWIKLADMGKTERRKLGEKARQRILDRYTIAAVSRQYTELYQRVGQS